MIRGCEPRGPTLYDEDVSPRTNIQAVAESTEPSGSQQRFLSGNSTFTELPLRPKLQFSPRQVVNYYHSTIASFPYEDCVIVVVEKYLVSLSISYYFNRRFTFIDCGFKSCFHIFNCLSGDNAGRVVHDQTLIPCSSFNL